MKAIEAGDAALAIVRQAMAWEIGSAPPIAGEVIYRQERFAMSAEEFRFITPAGIIFYYKRDEKLAVELPSGRERPTEVATLEDELELFGWGTVLGGVAWFNRLVPLHASAVAIDGRAVAFSGSSGAGKSTLAAALMASGHPLVCDDTLLVALSHEGPVAIPDGKRMKLWDDSLSRLRMTADREIEAAKGKHYVRPELAQAAPVPLLDLVMLERGNALQIEPIQGAEKLSRLADALYRDTIHLARNDQAWHGRLMTNLAEHLSIWRLALPFEDTDPGEYGSAIADLVRTVRSDQFNRPGPG